MKSLLVLIGLVTFLGTTSCSTYHYTGDRTGSKWSEADIRTAEKEINRVKGEVKKLLKGDTKAYMDCYMYQIIHNYDNFHKANVDLEGCTRLAEKCMKQF